MCCVRRITSMQEAREDGHHPENYRALKALCERHIGGKNTYLFNEMSSPLKNVERLKKINSYLLILGLFYKMHADQNASTCLTT